MSVDSYSLFASGKRPASLLTCTPALHIAWISSISAACLLFSCRDVMLPLDAAEETDNDGEGQTDTQTETDTDEHIDMDSETEPDSETGDGTDAACQVSVGQQMWLNLDGTCKADPSECEGGVSPLQDQAGTCEDDLVCCIDTNQCEAIDHTMMAQTECRAEACDEEERGGRYGCPDLGFCCF